jgi:hypothetical protein
MSLLPCLSCFLRIQIRLPRRATVAKLLHADLVLLIASETPRLEDILEMVIPTVRSNDKKRVPAPANALAPYALARETGCPEGISARRTPRALA